jgi:hypothetical protein
VANIELEPVVDPDLKVGLFGPKKVAARTSSWLLNFQWPGVDFLQPFRQKYFRPKFRKATTIEVGSLTDTSCQLKRIDFKTAGPELRNQK